MPSLPAVLDPARSLDQRRQAVQNLFDFVVGDDLADTRRQPSAVIDEGPQRTVRRYEPRGQTRGLPILLVPPLGAPASAMDLRRGCSLAEHLVDAGRPTYLVDYGEIGFSDRELGLEHWVTEVVPAAVRAVSEDTGDDDVALVGWCLGGIFSLVTAAAFPELPVAAVAMVASPFDWSANRMFEPLRAVGKVTGGRVLGGVARALGGAPPWLVGAAFKLTSAATYVKKPVTLVRHRDDREFLAHIEAVDELMNGMLAYPGRATLQAYLRLVQRNELASGKVEGPNRTVELADVRVPVLSVAGASDVLCPVAAAHQVGTLVPESPDVRLETAPGGHLGVLTGRAAKDTTWAVLDDFLAAHAP